MSESEQTDPSLLLKSGDKDQPPGAVGSTKENDKSHILECPICLQKCVYPVALPCEHIFCFLCIKGVMARAPYCALCRYQLPPDYCDRPSILDKEQVMASSQRPVSEDGHQWFYGGANGWWQYEDRVAKEIEEAYTKKEDRVSVSISGYTYIVDFKDMMQYRGNDPNRRRKIKRDVISTTKKGVAGILLSHDKSDKKEVEKDGVPPASTSSIDVISAREEPSVVASAAAAHVADLSNDVSTTEEEPEDDEENDAEVQDLSQSFQELSVKKK